MRYVIIGNSAAAVGCIEGIRQTDQKGEILVISDEPHEVYSRPLISYLLCGKTDRERMRYRPEDFYRKNAVRTMLGRRMERLLPEEHTAELDDGARIPYDKLLLATGSRPFVPPMKGLEQVEKKFTFLSLDDALALEEALPAAQNVLIVGAGLIGLKCAEGIYGRVRKITVVDLADRILPSILDPEAAGMVRAHLEDRGIEFRLSDSVTEFTRDRAALRSGGSVPFDLVVVAVGVRPNTELAAGLGVKAERGFVTDCFCRTAAPDVYAAGDCAQSRDVASGTDRVLALLPNAYMQGECAGIHMAGGEKPYDSALAMNAIGFFGLHMITAGIGDGEVFAERGEGWYKKLVTRDNRLVGYILLGRVERAGIYTAMIRNQTPLDTLDFEQMKQAPQLMAFGEAKRKTLLGGIPV